MYGNIRTPFAPALGTSDIHSQRPGGVPNGPVAYHYPNYNLYHVPTGHHSALHGPISTALARQYAAMAPVMEGVQSHAHQNHHDRDYTPEMDRRSSGERRASSARRGSVSLGSDQGQQGKKQQRFEILRKLGSGTYGKVSLAMDHKAGEEVAIKVIRKSAIENTADLIRIRREIRIMSALKHPNIIEIKEVFENNEKIILVMEYASGGELYDYVGKHGPLQEDEVRRMFRQIVSAVYYCHMHGVAHRDLKLENILLDRNMGAKIADFGLSNYFTEHILLRTFCGSPLYASPEIINGTPYKGPEVDCWSLGVLLYTLAYSSMPFDGRDFNRMARQIKRGAYYEPDPPSSASMLIRSMLRVNPERRATISEIAAHWWLNFDETGSSISDLPENQVLDSTPLYIRQETMMIQSFGEENEMFAEFTHLSDATRRKIEEFRRRRREAEWYLVECQSPLKKQSKKRSSSIVGDNQQRQSSQALTSGQKRSRESSVTAASGSDATARKDSNTEAPRKSSAKGFTAAAIAAGDAGGVPDEELLDNLTDPLNRLKALESRLHNIQSRDRSPSKQVGKTDEVTTLEDATAVAEESATRRPSSLSLDKRSKRETASAASTPKKQKPTALRMSVDDLVQEKRALDEAVDSATVASLASAVLEEGNRLVNQLLEEAMKGTVSAELVEKIQSSDAYQTEAFVKEILESVLSAQQIKPVPATPSTPTARPLKSKSRQASSSRSRKSSSSSTPLPDVVSAEGDSASKTKDSSPRPDVVAVVEVIPQAPTKAQTPPVSAVPLATKKLIYESVPEDAELQLATPVVGVDVDGEVTGTSGSSELEEDICSTDFEDLGSEEDEDEAAKARQVNDSSAASFINVPSQPSGELQEVHSLTITDSGNNTSATAAESAETEDNPFLRGLSKRLSRGKYERSKFTYTKGMSVDESPRTSRKQAEEEKKAKQDRKESLDETASGKMTAEDAANGQKRRYSDGDRNHLQPVAESGSWTKKSDSDLGSNQDVNSPTTQTTVEKEGQAHQDDGKRTTAPEKKELSEAESQNPEKNEATKPESSKAEDSTEVINASRKRRQERAKLKKVIRPKNPADAEKEQKQPSSQQLGTVQESKQEIDGNIPAPASTSVGEANIQDAPAVDAGKNADQPKPATKAATGTNVTEKAKPRKTVKKVVRRQSCANDKSTENEIIDGDKKASGRRASAVVVRRKLSVDEENLESSVDSESRKLIVDGENIVETMERATDKDTEPSIKSEAISTEPADNQSTAGQRRHSYISSLISSKEVQEEEKDASQDNRSSVATTGIDYHPTSATRSSKYQQLPSGGVAVADPHWLQYAREETQRIQQQASPYHGYGIGDYKSILGHGYDRLDDDWLGKSHAPVTSYRVGGQYSSRDTSPPRSGAGQYDSSTHGYNADSQTTVAVSRGRKGRSLYQQPSVDDYLADSGSSSSKRYNNPHAVTGYTPAYTRRTTGSGDYYKPLYDDNVVYRRHYDVPPQTEEDWNPETASNQGSGKFRVFQPKGLMKRRSRSLDKMNSRINLQDTDEVPDYDTGNYHGSTRYETSNISARQPPVDANSRAHLKSILKKQPNFDTTSTVGYSRYGDSETRRTSYGDPEARRTGYGEPEARRTSYGEPEVRRTSYGDPEGRRTSYGDTEGKRTSYGDPETRRTNYGDSEVRRTSYGDPESRRTTYGDLEGRKPNDDSTGRGFGFIDRLKRRFSTEKPSDLEFISSSTYRPKNESSIYSSVADTPSGYGDASGLYTGEGTDGKQGSKKRNYLPLSRRRTTEVRYGASDTGSAGYDDYTATTKRPTSPVEKAKGFFGVTATKIGRDPTSGTTSAANNAYHYSAAASPFSIYQSSNPATSAAPAAAVNTNYAPGYSRKPYGATGHRVTSYIPSNRYSYYEDPPAY